MSSSIPIPRSKKKASANESPESPSSFTSSSPSSTSSSPFRSSPASHNSGTKRPNMDTVMRDRRPSLLSESISKTEHIVINIGRPDAPRLISCVKASQGFNWNPEIFLPSYADHGYRDFEHRQEPVQDIILTDDEIKEMFPQ